MSSKKLTSPFPPNCKTVFDVDRSSSSDLTFKIPKEDLKSQCPSVTSVSSKINRGVAFEILASPSIVTVSRLAVPST